MNVYLSWVEFWKTEEFKKKSTTQKNNRRSGDDGRPSTHTSGSASHRVVAARMKIQYKCEPTADQLFKLTHTRRVKKKKNLICQNDEDVEDCEDGEEGELIWIDKKSQRIYETFLALLEQQKKAGLPVDGNARNALFLEATGGPDKKKRVYGLGSSQNLFYQTKIMPCTSSFASEDNQKLQQELKEVKDEMKELKNQLAMLIASNSIQRPQSPTDLDNQSDDNSM